MSAIVSFQPNFTSGQQKDPNLIINPLHLLFQRPLILHIEGRISMEDFDKGKKQRWWCDWGGWEFVRQRHRASVTSESWANLRCHLLCDNGVYFDVDDLRRFVTLRARYFCWVFQRISDLEFPHLRRPADGFVSNRQVPILTLTTPASITCCTHFIKNSLYSVNERDSTLTMT